MNIANFIEWFITQFISIASTMLAKLDQIIIYGNISLMDFIITITIITAFISILITAPQLTTLGGELGKNNYRPQHTYKPKHEKK